MLKSPKMFRFMLDGCNTLVLLRSMKNWKKSILFSLLFFFSLANCIETLHCIFEKPHSVIAIDIQSDDNEGKNSESEKSDTKEEKFNGDKNFNLTALLELVTCETDYLPIPFLPSFSSSDYSQVVYSPPEQLNS